MQRFPTRSKVCAAIVVIKQVSCVLGFDTETNLSGSSSFPVQWQI